MFSEIQNNAMNMRSVINFILCVHPSCELSSCARESQFSLLNSHVTRIEILAGLFF